jgi:hypothetical protein
VIAEAARADELAALLAEAGERVARIGRIVERPAGETQVLLEIPEPRWPV